MKRRIEELMNGIYEYKTPDLLFSCDEIRAVVKPGEKFFGSFTNDPSWRPPSMVY